MRNSLLAFAPLALFSTSCHAALVQSGDRPAAYECPAALGQGGDQAGAYAGATDLGDLVRIARSDDATGAAGYAVSEGIRNPVGYLIEARGNCPLGPVQYNRMSSELSLGNGMMARFAPFSPNPAEAIRVTIGEIRPLPEGWGRSDVTAEGAPAMAGYRFVTSTVLGYIVPGRNHAYVGIWARTDGSGPDEYVAASFRALGGGRYSEPRILLRSAVPLTQVFVGAAMHGDLHGLAVVQSIEGNRVIRLLTFDWFSARYFQR